MLPSSHSILTLIRVITLSLVLISCSDYSTNTSSSYDNKGFSLNLPNGWDVVDDFSGEDLRTVLIVSDDGGTLSIDIFQKLADDTRLMPPINEYFKHFVIATMPQQKTKDSARITYGTIDRFLGESLYAEIKVFYPETLKYFVETIRYEDPAFILYFTFQSPLSSATSTGNVIDLITREFTIKTI